jgi:hypothetical protein
MNPRRTPTRICVRHVANERADIRAHGRPPHAAPTPPGPPQPEASSVPSDDGLRHDDNERRSPSGQHTGEHDPEATVRRRELSAEAGSVAAHAVGAARPAPRAGARRANAPMCGGSGGARQAPTSSPRSVSIVGCNINCRNKNGFSVSASANARPDATLAGLDRINGHYWGQSPAGRLRT